MKSISFAWTTPALLAGEKTVTRRDWKEAHAHRFNAGELVAAYDRQARFGGKQVAVIRLTQAPYLENTRDIPPEDYGREGFTYLAGIDARIDGLTADQLWTAWRIQPRDMWVVRFELVEVLT